MSLFWLISLKKRDFTERLWRGRDFRLENSAVGGCHRAANDRYYLESFRLSISKLHGVKVNKYSFLHTLFVRS